MIVCDRCKGELAINTDFEMPFRVIAPGSIACISCEAEFRAGLEKIYGDISEERLNRIDKWRNEWLRNYKAK